MEWTLGHSLILILILLALAGGWLIWGRRPVNQQSVEPPVASPTEADQPAAPATTAVVDKPAPVAVLDKPPADAVEQEPAQPPTAEPVTTTDQAEPVSSAPLSTEQPAVAGEPAPAVDQVDEPAPVVHQPSGPAIESTAPPAATAPVADDSVAPDDFRRIQGIGPKIAAALQAAGIRTYQQLAETDVATLRATIRGAGLRAVPALPTWPEQARALATTSVPPAGRTSASDPTA